MAVGTAMALGGGALLGGLGGLFGSKSEQTQTSTVNAGHATPNETLGQQGLMDSYGQLQGMVGAGPGQSDVTASLGASRSLADMLQQYAQNGAQPGTQDISGANSLAQQLFAGQRTQLGQNFQDQMVQANRSAALMGRDMNDPILRAKMAQEQTRQSNMLDANQGSWATNYALQQPMQRLDFANQRASVLGGLATQAMSNRQALAAMGEGIMNNERNFRLQTASRTGTQTTQSGGGVGGFLSGMFAGAGAGASIAKGFGGFGGGGGAAPSVGGAGANPFSQGGNMGGGWGTTPTYGMNRM